jgi:hypothetical protein
MTKIKIPERFKSRIMERFNPDLSFLEEGYDLHRIKSTCVMCENYVCRTPAMHSGWKERNKNKDELSGLDHIDSCPLMSNCTHWLETKVGPLKFTFRNGIQWNKKKDTDVRIQLKTILELIEVSFEWTK